MHDVEGLVSNSALLDTLLRSTQTGAAPPAIRSAKIKLTARCNLRCAMCRFGRGLHPPELPTSRFLTIIDELAQHQCQKIHFSGGEVFVRKDFEELVTRAAQHDMKVTLTSNLTLIDKTRAKRLLRSKVSSISTSLDGARPKTHDRIRGVAGSFKRTIKAVEMLSQASAKRRRRLRLRINFTMMHDNFREYPAIVQLASELGAVDVVAMPVDDLADETSLRLSRSDIQRYNAEVAPLVLEARSKAGMGTEPTSIFPFGTDPKAIKQSAKGRYASSYYEKNRCYAPYTHIFIGWNGLVYLCCMTDEKITPLGDLSTQTVREVFDGEPFRSVRRTMEKQRLFACHRCDMFVAENRLIESAVRRLAVLQDR